jgi:cellobiose phosphorylase
LPPCLSARRADAEVYRVEPYVACQFIYGPESDRPGEGSHSWATGTAAWRLVVVREWMPGVRPELEGVRIAPCLSSGWTRAKLTRCTVDFLAVERFRVEGREGFLGGLRGAVGRKVSCLLLLASCTLLAVK